MKTVLATSSVVSLALGLTLCGLFVFTTDNPAVVLILGLSMAVQGLYTLVYMTGGLARFEPWAMWALLAGETIALMFGLGAGAVAFGETFLIEPVVDPEYGRVAVAGLIAFQALVTLYQYAIRDTTDIEPVVD